MSAIGACTRAARAQRCTRAPGRADPSRAAAPQPPHRAARGPRRQRCADDGAKREAVRWGGGGKREAWRGVWVRARCVECGDQVVDLPCSRKKRVTARDPKPPGQRSTLAGQRTAILTCHTCLRGVGLTRWLLLVRKGGTHKLASSQRSTRCSVSPDDCNPTLFSLRTKASESSVSTPALSASRSAA